jgi:hypothetical protein
MSPLTRIALAMFIFAAVAAPRTPALSDEGPASMHGGAAHDPAQMRQMMQQHHPDMMPAAAPTLPGQDAFGAIQEIVRILEADPTTDWSKVDLEALRQHLIDMNDVMLNAAVQSTPVEGGVRLAITGAGRTIAAIQRMVTAHAHELSQLNGWTAVTEPLDAGVNLTVTASDPKEVAHIRGLGFAGLMVSGAHHQPHHLAIARGEFAHGHP